MPGRNFFELEGRYFINHVHFVSPRGLSIRYWRKRVLELQFRDIFCLQRRRCLRLMPGGKLLSVIGSIERN